MFLIPISLGSFTLLPGCNTNLVIPSCSQRSISCFKNLMADIPADAPSDTAADNTEV